MAALNGRFASNWSVKAEYMFIGLGDRHVSTTCGSASLASGATVGGGQFCFDHEFPGIHTAKIGLNYRFGSSGSRTDRTLGPRRGFSTRPRSDTLRRPAFPAGLFFAGERRTAKARPRCIAHAGILCHVGRGSDRQGVTGNPFVDTVARNDSSASDLSETVSTARLGGSWRAPTPSLWSAA